MEERVGERRRTPPLLNPLPTPASWGEEEARARMFRVIFHLDMDAFYG